MPDEFSVRLCSLVQMYPALYDIFNEGFRDEEAKDNAWQEIARDLGVAQSKCVIKWKSLKHQYVKAKKEKNTTWDLWPYLQFLDETTAAKSGPKKRKRESTATPMKMETSVSTDVDMPSADSAGMENVEVKTATRSSRSTRTSTIYKETVMTPMKGAFATAETGTPLQPVATASRANPEKKQTKAATARTARSKRSDVTVTKVSEQSFLSQIPFLYWRASSVNDTVGVGEVDFTETGTPLQTVNMAPEPAIPEPSNKLSEPVQPTPARGSARRQSARAPEPVIPEPSNNLSEPVQPTPTRGSTRRQSARVSLVRVDADAASATSQANGTSSGTPLKEAAVITLDETPAVQPAANAQEATVSEAIRKGSPRKVAATSQAAKMAAASPAPTKATAASPAPPKARVSSTPRGRRSTRPAPAEMIPEEPEDNEQVEPPQPKRQRMEGNGIGANDQADALADMKFETALDQKFFKQLKEKFDKLRPEVASTIKASIFKMLDEAADN
uniref:MADF domain-containing protein n=1 Tax=Rhipicephalus appendiculatus TaxID=34631 RepID=A0A131YZ13_RHIAP